MPISFAEPLDLECPRCGTPFQTETWIVVDGHERPDLVARILDGTLHDATCPNCGQSGEVPAPVLYHDGRTERVLLAVPPGMDEAEWREAGQTLLWTLIGALPEQARAPYLGQVQAEAGLDGIAAVIREERLAGVERAPDEETLPPIVSAIQALLGAHGPEELQRALQRHPILLDPQAVMILRELAHEAFKQGEEEAGSGFSRAADILNDVRDLSGQTVLRAPTERPAVSAPASAAPPEDPLDELAFALLRSHTGEMLAATVDKYPQLLEPEMDAELAAWAERARGEGKPRIADGIDERRDVLREMRERSEAERPVLEAVQALLEAETSDDLEAVLVEHDALFTDEADAMLGRLVESADEDFKPYVAERHGLLQRVRNAMREQASDEGGT